MLITRERDATEEKRAISSPQLDFAPRETSAGRDLVDSADRSNARSANISMRVFAHGEDFIRAWIVIELRGREIDGHSAVIYYHLLSFHFVLHLSLLLGETRCAVLKKPTFFVDNSFPMPLETQQNRQHLHGKKKKYRGDENPQKLRTRRGNRV